MSDEEIQELLEWEKEVIEAVVELVKKVVDTIVKTFVPICKVILEWLEHAYNGFPNKHLFWLALHHSRERVRKRNMHRIMRYYKRRFTK